MIWGTEGDKAVAVVLAWLRSDRWQEAMRLSRISRSKHWILSIAL